MSLTPFLGVWRLDPSSCDYQPAPREGLYTVMPSGDGVHFDVQWTDAEGEVQALNFFSALDGEHHALEEGATLVGRIQDGTLITEVFLNGQLAQTAHRSVHNGVMAVTQITPAGRMTALYDRARVKQVICYRRDLKMRKGKIAAQCAHASLGAVIERRAGPPFEIQQALPGPVAWWLRRGSAKIVVSVDDEAALLQVAALAEQAGIPHCVITDAGKTEFGGVPTKTAVAVGPWVDTAIDAITGKEGAVATKLA